MRAPDRAHAVAVLAGFLRQLATADEYEPDIGCLVLGHAARSSMTVAGVATPIMAALAERFEMDVLLATRDRLEMLVLEHCRSGAAHGSVPVAGALLPMEVTAIGRAFLWAQSPPLQGELIARIRIESSDKGARSIPGIYRAFQEIEERGFCTVHGEWRRDVLRDAARQAGTSHRLGAGESRSPL